MAPALWLAACARSPEGRPAPEPTSHTPSPPAPTTPAPTLTPLAPPSAVTDAVHPQFGSLVVVSWHQDADADARVEFAVDGEAERSSPARALSAGDHSEWIVGVPYGADVRYRVALTRGDERAASPDRDTRAGDLPAGVPSATVHREAADPTGPLVLTTLGELGEPFWVLIVDRSARPVWALRTPDGTVSLHPRVARTGDALLVDHDSFWGAFDGGAASEVARMTLDGTVQHVFATPGLHHGYTDLADGAIAYPATDAAYANEVVWVVGEDGSAAPRFDCGAWLQDHGGGACASNSLGYDDARDRLLLSLFSIETVVELDATTGAAERWYGHLAGSWAFDPPDAAFWWQHGAYVTDEGTLLVSSDLTSDGVETVAREYALDEGAETLREVWSAGVGGGVYGQYAGEAVREPGGATLHDFGELPRLREYTPAGDVAWDVEWDAGYIGRSSPIVDPWALLPPLP